jgi:hypothetical protein
VGRPTRALRCGLAPRTDTFGSIIHCGVRSDRYGRRMLPRMTTSPVEKPLIGIRLGPPDEIGAWLADAAAFDAAGADALWIDLTQCPDVDAYVLVAALAAMTYRARLVLRRADDRSDQAARTLDAVSRGRFTHSEGHAADGWEATGVPDERAAWRQVLADAGQRGVAGLVVDADPRLLDLLRNPDTQIDRSDLQLAQG